MAGQPPVNGNWTCVSMTGIANRQFVHMTGILQAVNCFAAELINLAGQDADACRMGKCKGQE